MASLTIKIWHASLHFTSPTGQLRTLRIACWRALSLRVAEVILKSPACLRESLGRAIGLVVSCKHLTDISIIVGSGRSRIPGIGQDGVTQLVSALRSGSWPALSRLHLVLGRKLNGSDVLSALATIDRPSLANPFIWVYQVASVDSVTNILRRSDLRDAHILIRSLHGAVSAVPDALTEQPLVTQSQLHSLELRLAAPSCFANTFPKPAVTDTRSTYSLLVFGCCLRFLPWPEAA